MRWKAWWWNVCLGVAGDGVVGSVGVVVFDLVVCVMMVMIEAVAAARPWSLYCISACR
jgi:hypothetical protein